MLKTALVTGIVTLSLFASEKTENQIAYEKAVEAETKRQIDEAEKRIAFINKRIPELRKQIANKDGSPPPRRGARPARPGRRTANSKDPADEMRELKAEKRDLVKQKRLLEKGRIDVEPVIRMNEIEIGDLGRIVLAYQNQTVSVFEVKDDRRAVFTVMSSGEKFYVDRNGKPKTRFEQPKPIMFFGVAGIDTSNLSERKRFTLEGEYIVEKTARYQYEHSTKGVIDESIFILRPFERDWKTD